MTYRVLVSVLSEAGTIDMRGMASIIGIMGARVMVPQVPTQLGPTFTFVAEQEEYQPLPEGELINFGAEVTAPDGSTLFAQHQQSPLGQSAEVEGPHRIQAVVTMPVTAATFGAYRFTLRFDVPTLSGPEHLEATRTLRVDQV